MVNLQSRSNIFDMQHKLFHIVFICLVSFLLTSTNLCAQRVSFGTYATDGIILTKLNTGDLDFNKAQTIILAGQTVLLVEPI